MNINRISSCSGLLVVVAGLVFSSVLQAAPLNFANEPLYLQQSVDSNVFFEVDDSGSMDWEIQTPPYWRWCAYDNRYSSSTASNSDCDSAMKTDGAFSTRIKSGSGTADETFYYIFATGDNVYTSTCPDAGSNNYAGIESCGANYIPSNRTTSGDWRVLSSSFNVLYYDPSITYGPWLGTDMTDQVFSASRSNPQGAVAAVSAVAQTAVVDAVPSQSNRDKQTGYDLTRDLGAAKTWLSSRTGFEYHEWTDTHGFSGTRPRRGTNINRTVGANKMVDYWDEHVRYRVTATAILRATVTYSVDGSGNITENVTESTATDDGHGRSLADAQKNIANWYSYARRRMHTARGAVGAVVSNSASSDFRFGVSVINEYTSLFNTVPPASVTRYGGYNKSLLNNLYSFKHQMNGTPLRSALRKDGLFYSNSIGTYSSSLTSKVPANPVTEACQQNYTILITDGYWNDSFNSVADSDGDGVSSTLADVSNYYATRDLQPGLANQVPVPNDDDRTFQHMETFTVAFGVYGDLLDSDGNGLPDKTRAGANFTPAKNVLWGDVSSDPGKIDDLWHAAYNSTPASLLTAGGDAAKRFISATSPAVLVQGLTDALSAITNSQSSSASVAASSGTLRDESAGVFQARFVSGDWYGNLLRFQFTSTGTVSETPSWEAKDRLNAQDYNTGRTIVTYKPSTKAGIPFRWPTDYTSLGTTTMDSSQVTSILSGATTGQQLFGSKVINYLRGDRSNEGAGSGQFRMRQFVLGDIIDSNPAYYAAPNLPYPDTLEPSALYSEFKSSKASRTPMVYVGANDGMLHGFDSNTGNEKLAYVPSKVYSNLTYLTTKTYAHRYFVNAAPLIADVFYSGSWHTILLGGLGQGGQGIYALDITNPSSFTEANASSIVRWEFNDSNDADLGYTFSRPAVGKVKTGTNTYKWVAVFGNGYNSVTSDGAASTTGNAVLYVVDVQDGTLLKKISLPVTGDSTTDPNGLSSPALVDYNGDYIFDYVYAGDLKGNLWRVDLTGDTASWKVAYGTATAPKPVFKTNTGQPITVAPVSGRHPEFGGIMVYFGTGKFLESNDNSRVGKTTQSFYAVWDNLQSTASVPYTASNLLQQTIQSETFFTRGSTYEIRGISNNAISWTTHKGWRIDFVLNGTNDGELLAVKPVLRNDRIIFVSWVPGEGGCAGGGESWLWELDAFSGSPLTQPPLDLNNDGTFDSGDIGNSLTGGVNGDGAWRKPGCTDPAACSGGNGLMTTPTIVAGAGTTSCGEAKVMSSSSGEVESINESCGINEGRQSWRQLK